VEVVDTNNIKSYLFTNGGDEYAIYNDNMTIAEVPARYGATTATISRTSITDFWVSLC
jgi:hypothetical protein